MNSKQIKRLMTDVAKGEITMLEANKLISQEKVAQEQSEDEIEAEDKPITKKTQKRPTKSKGRLK